MRKELIDMNRKSPLRTGGVVCVHRPESMTELVSMQLWQPHLPVIGALSNTAVLNSASEAISTTLLKGWEFTGINRIRVLCGTMMPQLVRELAKHGYGGFEYLSSVPGTAGGCVYMNAGRGGNKGALADWIESVAVVDGQGRMRTFNRREMDYDYRKSRLLRADPALIVVSVTLRVNPVDEVLASRKIQERLGEVREKQDRKWPNLGTIFCRGWKMSLAGVAEGGMKFSSKTPNWIINIGGGTAEQFQALVKRAKARHLEAGYTEPEEEICWLG